MRSHRRTVFAYVRRWFRRSGWKAFPFQEEAWNAYLDGDHGLVYSPTGTGKTLAVFLGPLMEWLIENPAAFRDLNARFKQMPTSHSQSAELQQHSLVVVPPKIERTSVDKLNRVKVPRRRLPQLNADSQIRVLWVTPLRALATDTTENLATAIDELGLTWRIEKRTGDTDPAIRNRQRKRFPEVLVTTPESLSLMLSWPDSLQRFVDLKLAVVDEWHDLMGTKRGVQMELALARIRQCQPAARIWGLSATIGNLDEAPQTLCGFDGDLIPSHGQSNTEMVEGKSRPMRRLVQGNVTKATEIQSLIPDDMERFPWAGHLGIRLAPQVARLISNYTSSLIFTNTRSQTELWYRALIECDPRLAGRIAVHHGSLDRQLRDWVENALRDGSLTCCVCTASLDLGVDFTVVDHVVQVGSPKGNARLLQRAGRSGHQPGTPSRVTFVPTNAIELVELAALRDSIAAGDIESRPPLRKPLDVLAQHVVTVALGGGFDPDDLVTEVRTTVAYNALSDQEWQWVLSFAEHGGSSLNAYPDFHRIEYVDGRYLVNDRRVARLHRLSIGTIVSDAAVQVKYVRGGSLGTVEESFIGRMEPGDKFMLGGKLLELVKVQDNTAYVKRAKGKTTTIPRWMGGRMPLSTELSRALREKIEQIRDGRFDSPELQSVKPLMELQRSWSAIPAADQLLVEQLKHQEGFHLFFYPFDGRLVHEGLAALFAWRMSRLTPVSFSLAMNDYGFVLTSPTEAPFAEAIGNGLFDWKGIADDIFGSLNETEMVKRQFRGIARVAGLIFEGYPGQPKRARHLQASSNLFYNVFAEYDPENLLLLQAQREVLEGQLEANRLIEALKRIGQSELLFRELPHPTPFAFPLLVDRLRDRLSSESLADRIQRMRSALEKAADSDGL